MKIYYVKWLAPHSAVVAGTFGPFGSRGAAESCVVNLSARADVGEAYIVEKAVNETEEEDR